MLLTIKEYKNIIILLETIIININIIDSDLSLNGDIDVNLLNILDNNL
jgi:hypothetical protein